ncbi:hypothetical protein KHP62_06890 [Rhodobacteraceae bacterium NNCM2]|nr:hypothetical protein [Coraliihabitans acroporae]
MIRPLLLVALLAACGAQTLDPGDPLSGSPIRFMEPGGTVLQIDRIYAAMPEGSLGAPIPTSAQYPIDQDKLDLGFVPLVGGLFGRRIAPGDAARDGAYIAPVYLDGSALVMDLSDADPGVLMRPVSVATMLRRGGPVRYDIGLPTYQKIAHPATTGEPIGHLYTLAGRLVIASEGDLPALSDYFDVAPYAE